MNTPTPKILIVSRSLSLAFAIGLAWAVLGGVWTPLSQVSWGIQKVIGGGAILFLLTFAFLRSFRRAAVELTRSFETMDPALRRSLVLHFFFSVGCVLSFAAIYRHNSLQSGTFDLGILLNATWNFSHGFGFYDPVLHFPSYLGDHWQPILIAYAPLLRWWPNASPFLLSQGFSIAIAGYGIYRFGVRLLKGHSWSLLCAVLFLLHRDVHKINRFHFHPEVLGFAILVWLWYVLTEESFLWSAVLVGLCWLLKEDFPVNTFAVGAAFVWMKPRKTFGYAVMFASAVAFVLIVAVAMPHFLGSASPTHLVRYANLGATPSAILRTIVFSPHRVAWGVISDPWFWDVPNRYLPPFLGLPLLSGPMLLASGLAWLPHALSAYFPQRSLQCQYGIPELCFLALGCCYGVARLWRYRDRSRILNAVLTSGPVPITVAMLAVFAFGVPRYFRPERSDRIRVFREVVRLIPETASVSAQDNLGPHVAYRHELREFPSDTSADYVIADERGNTWPVTPEEIHAKIAGLMASNEFDVLRSEAGFTLLKRR